MGYKGKRFLDITISLFLLMILFPLFLLIALVVKFFSGSPVIHHRKTIGFKGESFIMLKFRSMITGADEREEEIFRQTNGKKLFNDPRITRIGAILRKTSLDELPQFINVIKGEMSLVGPRPKPSWAIEGMSGSIKKTYFSLRPGITGLVQITNRSLSRFSSECGRLESVYLEKCSLSFDLKILLKSIPAVIFCRGAR